MRASSILSRSSVEHPPDSPFSVEHVRDAPAGGGGGGNGGGGHPDAGGDDLNLRGRRGGPPNCRPPRGGRDDPVVVIDRRSAWDASVLHGRWISRLVSDFCSRRRDVDVGDDDVEDLPSPDELDDDEVVVAYLTWNSPDVMLSLLGCMEVASADRDDDGAEPPPPTPITFASSSPSQGTSDGAACSSAATGGRRGIVRRRRRRILPAMLNARWTPAEIAAALSVSPAAPSDDDGEESGRGDLSGTTTTLILHGEGFERAAREASDLLLRDGDGRRRRRRHVVRALPIPTFGSAAAAAAEGLRYDRGGGTDAIPVPQSPMNISSVKYKDGEDTGETAGYPPLPSIDKHPSDVCTDAVDSSFDDTDDAIILFTSGTSSSSGTAKGVRLSHRSLLVQAWAKMGDPCRYDSSTRMVATTVPFFHVGGLSSALAVIAAGGTLVFPAPRKEGGGGGMVGGFDAKGVLSMLSSSHSGQRIGGASDVGNDRSPHRPPTPSPPTSSLAANTLVVVPAMIHAMLELIERNDISNSSPPSSSSSRMSSPAVKSSTYPGVRLVLIGGQSATSAQLSRARRAFPNARFVQTYACTEAGSSITFLHRPSPSPDADAEVDSVARRYGGDCVGLPPSHVEIGIFPVMEGEGADGGDHPEGPISRPYDVGLIGTRGPHVMNGYWRRGSRDRQTRQLRDGDGDENGGGSQPAVGGWLVTNDVGYLDDRGTLYFCGRASDVVRTGGETVFAPEVERVLSRHGAVECCAVFALPHDRLGETVAVAVVLRRRGHVNNNSRRRRLGVDGDGDGDDEGSVHRKGTGKTASLAEDDVIISHLRDDFRRLCSRHNLSGYKWPRKIFVVDELPRNSSGKVLKHRLKEMFAVRPSGGRMVPANRSYL